MAPQLVTGDIWSLVSSPLSFIYHVCVSVVLGLFFFFLLPPLVIIYPLSSEKALPWITLMKHLLLSFQTLY